MLVASSVEGLESVPTNCATPLPKSVPFGIGRAFRNGWVDGIADCRALSEGTVVLKTLGRSRRSPSYEKKKKVRFRRSGPPKTPPKSFCLSFAFGRPKLLANQ